ncbi:MAG: tetratricopeptide repeat protein [Bacteroidia bacterium]|nr:tetratricopeptide repeat protein [Bacteroidia bacterium]
MKNIRKFCFLALPLLLLLGGCGSAKKTAEGTAAAPKSSGGGNGGGKLSEQEHINVVYAFFDAQKEKAGGNEQRAAELFAQCLRIDPKNHAAMYELSSIYNQKGKINDALFFIKSAVALDPENEWYLLLLANTYEKSGKFSEAIGIYQQLHRKYPERIEYLFNESDALLMQGKLQEAIKVYDRIEAEIGVNREMTMQKQRLFLKMGKVNEAAAELEKLIKTDPENLDNYSLLVELWQVNNQPDKAMETIRRMQAIDPENPGIALALAEQYRSEGKRAESFEQLKKAFSSPQLASEIKIRILTSYLPLVESSPEMMDQALELSKRLSQTHPGEANPQTVYADFLSVNKQFQEARNQYRAGLAIDKKNLQAWQQLLIVESELRDYAAMEAEAEEAQGLFPDQSILYLFNGIAKIQNKKYEEAARTLLSGSKLVVDNDQQQMEFYSNLGDVYDKLKKYSDSDKYYEKALRIDGSNVYVLNNWAYYLSLRNEQLDKAAEMSKRSNEISTNNPSFLDTYAWILYRQGKYTEALSWLDKARLSGGEENGTILEHYGDTLFRLGRESEALEYWQKARKTGDHSELLDKKLNDKKLYE